MLGHSVGDRFSLRTSLVLVLLGISGLYIEIINAFEYMKGARKGFLFFYEIFVDGDVGDLMMVTIFRCWRQKSMLVSFLCMSMTFQSITNIIIRQNVMLVPNS